MQLKEIRKLFLEYFKQYNHRIVKSSSLIPNDDPTLLFTNAGMNQFKDVFLGLDKRSYTKAVSVQKCVRAGGKHNDLENVGYTARHHTFFEMLGNFSFGDYFKRESINLAWKFLTEVLNIAQNRLYVTVYYIDDESYNIWHKEIGLSKEHIIRIADKLSGGSDNFWQMGDTGPCGPCTEIFYDHGSSVSGELPGSAGEDGDRYIEIWNCVFMEYNRDEQGKLHRLPKPSVDTGMGLERIAAVMQQVHSNYEIDLFQILINQAAKITHCQDLSNPSLKVLADHIRSVAFLIADGALPSNEGRGYVLRRIMRRAIRHGYKLGSQEPFLFRLVAVLVTEMGDVYPELVISQIKIEQIIMQEEEKFFQTIDKGMILLQQELSNLATKELSGEIAFKLYDTYGFPLDLTQDICRELGIIVDNDAFEAAMTSQRNKAKSYGKFKMNSVIEYNGVTSEFCGYDQSSITATVIALFKDNQAVSSLADGDDGVIVLDKTVFYAESGGQVGDSGVIQINDGLDLLFHVTDTHKLGKQVIGHWGKVHRGSIAVGDIIEAAYDIRKRKELMRNHSATHLLHKALHEVLGKHAIQKGSLVCSEYTRFDFAHDKPVSKDELKQIEYIVNHAIMMNYVVSFENMSYNEALNLGIMALFSDKYEDMVRVIKMGDFSAELCGGTHVIRTGDIGLFTITNESGVANGVRRIEAITGEAALNKAQWNRALLEILRDELKAQNSDTILDKVIGIQEEARFLTKRVNELNAKLVTYQADSLLDNAILLNNGIKSLVIKLTDLDNKALLELIDKLKDKLKSGIVTIGCQNGQKVNLIIGVTPDLIKKYKAGNIISQVAAIIGGKGGGRPDLAQAGGSDVARLPEALNEVNKIILNC